MNTYFSTFVSGLGEVAEEALKSKVPGAKVSLVLDGVVVYTTMAPYKDIRELRFLNNSFALLESVKGLDSDETLEMLIEKVMRERITVPVERRTSFRIIFSKENQLVGVEQQILQALEKRFVSGELSVNRNNPGVELFFLSRDDGHGFFGLRLTRHRDYKKTLHPGELRPELANLLCFISEPKGEDVFLDPFAGYGAIPIERALAYPYRRIYAGDSDRNLAMELKQKTSHFGHKFNTGCWEATSLGEVKNESVDKIVTDPPWGSYSTSDNLDKLCSEFFIEARRMLKPGGILVMLTAKKITTDLFLLQKRYDILVSGKKATVYKFSKEVGR